MSFGRIRNGTVVLENGMHLSDGLLVKTTPVKEAGEELTLIGLFQFAGYLNDSPADFAAEHDHYIHGTPKRSEES